MIEGFDLESVIEGEGTEILRVKGPLDAKSAPLLLDHCARVRGAGRNLVLNLSGVSLIASSGVGALLALVEEHRRAHTSVRIAEASPAVDSVVRLLNLDRFLSMDPSEKISLAAITRH